MASTAAKPIDLSGFLKKHMKKGNRFVPARLQATLALLEKLRETPSLELLDHLAARGSSGLKSHEDWGDRAHQRFQLDRINKNHGRRSSNLQDWGQELLDLLRSAGFDKAKPTVRSHIIDAAQSPLAGELRNILQQEPLTVRLKGRTAVAVIAELLEQAQEKGKSGDVAQYLVAAKLELRFGLDMPLHQANRGDRKSRSDVDARAGDYEIEDAVIEIAIGLPDEKHIDQVASVLEKTDKEVWLLTRADRVDTWEKELAKMTTLINVEPS